MAADIARREFISALGAVAAAWPLSARAQQPGMPVIGFLGSSSANAYAVRLVPFHQALKEAGLVDGQNVSIEYRWAEDHYGRLPTLAAELVRAQAAVIIAVGGAPASLAAKAATSTIPIVFQNGSDPVKLGLVASLARPGGNMTGVTNLSVETTAKRLELIRELVPSATVIGYVLNPRNPNAAGLIRELQGASGALRREVVFANVASESDLDAAFATLVQQHAGAIAITADPIFASLSDRLVELAARRAIPTMFPFRESVVAGGLVSFGASFADGYRQLGVYTARILKGEKPAELPVMQSTKFELVINLKTAKTLGIDVPMSFLMRIDEAIE